jgi:hypothetical protein
MAEALDVGVSIYIIDRISRDLVAISRQFTSGDQAVRRMEASIRKLESAHALLGNRLNTTQLVQARNLALLKQRLTLMDSGLAKEQLQARIANLTATQALTNAETQNRLLQMRNDLTERNIALTEAQARAQREAMIGGAQRNIMGGAMMFGIGAGGLYGIGRLATAGFDIERAQAMLRIAGGMTARQTQQISDRALALSQQLGVVNWADAIQIVTKLYQTLPAAAVPGVMGPIATAADLIKLLGKGELGASAAGLGQMANVLGATTAGGALQVGTAAMNILRQAPIDMAQLADFATYVARVTPGANVGARTQQFYDWAMLSARLGGMQGGVSGRNIADLLLMMTTTANPRAVALQGILQRYGLARDPQGRTMENITQTIRRAEQSQRGPINLIDLMAGSRELVALFHQVAQTGQDTFDRIDASSKNLMSTTEAWQIVMSTTASQVDQLHTSFSNLGKVIGTDLDPHLAPTVSYFNDMVNSLTNLAKAHPEIITNQLSVLATVFGSLAAVGAIRGLIGLGTLVTGLSAGPFIAGVLAFTALVELLANLPNNNAIANLPKMPANAVPYQPQSWWQRFLGTPGGMPMYQVPMSSAAGGQVVHWSGDVYVNAPGMKGTTAEMGKAIAQQLRRALTAAPAGLGITESPLLHGGKP